MSKAQRIGLAAAGAATVWLAWPALQALAGQLAAAYLLMGLALPVCRILERRLSPSLSAGASLMLLGAAVLGALLSLIPPLARQFRQLSDILPGILERIKASLAQSTAWLAEQGIELTALREELTEGVSRLAGGAVSALAGGTARLARSAGKLFLAPLFAFYLLKDRRKICANFLVVTMVQKLAVLSGFNHSRCLFLECIDFLLS